MKYFLHITLDSLSLHVQTSVSFSTFSTLYPEHPSFFLYLLHFLINLPTFSLPLSISKHLERTFLSVQLSSFFLFVSSIHSFSYFPLSNSDATCRYNFTLHSLLKIMLWAKACFHSPTPAYQNINEITPIGSWNSLNYLFPFVS